MSRQLVYVDDILKRITSEKEDNWKRCNGKYDDYDMGVNNGLTMAHAIAFSASAAAIDVEEVVRCKDCKKSEYWDENNIALCVETNRYVAEYDFCSDGERKD